MLQVSYYITGTKRRNSIDNVSLTDGYTTVQDIPKMIAMRNKVTPSRIRITLIRELTS